MWEKFQEILSARWPSLLFVLLAMFKSSEFGSGLFKGSAAWVAESVTMLLFLGAYLSIELGHVQLSRNVARRIRTSLLVLLIVAVTWDALRATHPVLTNRMEHERLLQIHRDMERTEQERLEPLYKGSGRLSRRRWCEPSPTSPMGHSHPECTELYQRRKEIAEFLLRRPEPSENTEELRKTLRARQLRLQELLLRYTPASKSLPEPVVFPLSGRRYSYWEMIEWIGASPLKIEVQAVFARLMRNALVLTTALIFTLCLKTLVLGHPVRRDSIASAAHPSSTAQAVMSTAPIRTDQRAPELPPRMTAPLSRRVAASAPIER